MLVHRFWMGETQPPVNAATLAAHKDLGHEVVEWSPDDLPREIQTLASQTQWFVPSFQIPIHWANVARWWVLRENGGWWADCDLMPHIPFTELPFPATAAHTEIRCTAWMGFPPNHEVCNQALEHLTDGMLFSTTSNRLSGEFILDQFCPSDIPRIFLSDSTQWAMHPYRLGEEA